MPTDLQRVLDRWKTVTKPSHGKLKSTRCALRCIATFANGKSLSALECPEAIDTIFNNATGLSKLTRRNYLSAAVGFAQFVANEKSSY